MTSTPPDTSPSSLVDRLLADLDAPDQDARDRVARDYIGASSVGKPCQAFLGFSLRGFPDEVPSARMLRIFNLGHHLEDRVIEDLRSRGYLVRSRDPKTGRQYRFEAWGGHISCAPDGIIDPKDGTGPMILEIKSMNRANFGKFKAKGVKVSHPVYYAQVQMVMGMADTDRTLFLAICKDTSTYHAEIVDADPFEISHIEHRVLSVLTKGARERISSDPEDWRCRGCSKWGSCHGDTPPPRRCQTCDHAAPTPAGTWHCTLHDAPALLTCDQWVVWTPTDREDPRGDAA